MVPAKLRATALGDWRSRRGLVLLSLMLALGFFFYYYVDRYVRLAPSATQINTSRLEELVKKAPADAHLRLQLAESYGSQRRRDEAIRQYQSAIKLQAENPAAYLGMGNVYFAQGKYPQAQEAYQKVQEFYKDSQYRRVTRPLNPMYYNLAVMQEKEGKLDEAVASLEEALALDRVDADALHLLGTIRLRQGLPQEAAKSCEEAISYVPNFKEAYETLAAAYGQLGERELQLFAKGMGRYSEKEYSGAIPMLEEAARALPDREAVQVGLALAYEKNGQKEKALDTYRTAERLNQNSLLIKGGIRRLTQP